MVGEFARSETGRWELCSSVDKSNPNSSATVQSTYDALQDHLTLRSFLNKVCSKRALLDQLYMEYAEEATFRQVMEASAH